MLGQEAEREISRLRDKKYCDRDLEECGDFSESEAENIKEMSRIRRHATQKHAMHCIDID